jgi:hypothetical protein
MLPPCSALFQVYPRRPRFLSCCYIPSGKPIRQGSTCRTTGEALLVQLRHWSRLNNPNPTCAPTYTSGKEFVKYMEKKKANSGTSTTVLAQQDPRATGSDTENAKTAGRSQDKAKINPKVYTGAAMAGNTWGLPKRDLFIGVNTTYPFYGHVYPF